MTRREMFSRLVGAAVPVSAVALTIAATTPEKPLTKVHPYCPRCGFACYWDRRSAYVGDVVPVVCPNQACGWTGAAPEMEPMK